VQELIDAERVPEARRLWRQTVPLRHPLFRPIHMIVDDELAGRDGRGEQQRSGRDHEIDERRQSDVDSRMQQSVGMAVDAMPLSQYW
jgi:hypothetical protein